jgi:predicted transposase/invertase (TIGR01784 family)
MRPVFADPKTDFVFKRLFGSEAHKDLAIALLNTLLALEGDRRIATVTFLREEERPRVPEMKLSIVDVKCQDHRGTRYVVEMQVLNVEGFEKRVVYNASKAYVNQLGVGQEYPALDDVVAVSICDFVLWPDAPGEAPVPLVSRWRMQERAHGRVGLTQVQYVFVELPKFARDQVPTSVVEEWAYVFRNAEGLRAVPDLLHADETRRALEAARTAAFNEADWDAYDRARIAEQDSRGALALALHEGRAEGRAEGAARMLLLVLRGRGLAVSTTHEAQILATRDLARLEAWTQRALTASTTDDALAD